MVTADTRQNPLLLFVMFVLGLLAVLRNGYEHPVLFYLLPLAGLVGLWQLSLPGRKWEGRLAAPLLLFLGAGVLSYFFSINRQETLAELLKTGLYIILFWLAATRLRLAEGRRLGNFLLLVGGGIALFAVLSFIFLSPGRVTGTFINSNPFGLYMAMLALLALGLLAEGAVLAAVLAAVLTLDAMVLSGSRGSLLAFVAALVVLGLLLPRGERRRALPAWALTGGLAAVSLVLVFNLAPLLQGLGDRAPGLGEVLVRSDSFAGVSLQGRLSFWQVAWRMIAARPLTGFGLGNYQNAYMFFRNQDHFYSRYVHNHYLQTWAEAGVFSLLGLALFFLLFAARAWRRRGYSASPGWYAGLAAAALAFALHISIDFSWDMPAVAATFWVVLGLLYLEGRGEEEPAPALPGAAGVAGPASPPAAGRGRRWLATGALALFLLLSGQQLLAHWLFTAGQRAARAGDWPRAIAHWQAAERVLPVNPRYPASLAVAWQEEARRDPAAAARYLEQALAAARRAVALSPWGQGYWRQLGRLAWRAGNYAEAEAALRSATRYGGYLIANHLELGSFYLERQRWAEAETVLREGLALEGFALRNAPTDEVRQGLQRDGLRLRLALARALEEEGRPADARGQLAAVLAEEPGNEVARREMRKYETADGPGLASPDGKEPAR